MHAQFTKQILILGLLMSLVMFVSPSFAQDHTNRDYETAIAKGTLQIETGEYRDAIASLNKALAIKAADKAATQSLGIAYSRSGDYIAARRVLLKALEIDKTDLRTRYELGIANYKLGDLQGAGRLFHEVADGGAEEDLTIGAKRYLDLLSSEDAGYKREAFTLDALSGLQYDSNVILEPSDAAASDGKKADWRAIAMVNAAYPFFKRERAAAEAEYRFYQSVHNNLHSFDVQQHNLGIGAKFEAADDVRTGLNYQFSYSLVGRNRYSNIHRIMPSVSLALSTYQAAELAYTYESKKFYENSDFIGNSDRTGYNNAFGLTYRHELGRDLGISAGYTYDKDFASASYWSYTGHKGSAGAHAVFAGFTFFAELSYAARNYEDTFPGFTDTRIDHVQEYSLNIVRDVSRRIRIDLSEQYVKNRSTLAPYDYTRNITGLFVVVSL
jgi:tetratricopeptide (TPR) repeat protein